MIIVSYQNHFSTSSNHFLHVLQFAIMIILESMYLLSYVVFLPIKVVNSSVMRLNNHAMPSLPNLQELTLITVR